MKTAARLHDGRDMPYSFTLVAMLHRHFPSADRNGRGKQRIGELAQPPCAPTVALLAVCNGGRYLGAILDNGADIFIPQQKMDYNRVFRFSVQWTIAAFVLLSLVPEKKTRYLLPMLIPGAINIGFYIWYSMRNLS